MTTVNTLQSGGQGTAVPAGYIGEKITWASAPSTQSLTTSAADWTNASITLTAGIWLIQANISAGVSTGATAGNQSFVTVRITDSSNNIVQNMDKELSIKTSAAASAAIIATLPFSMVVNLSVSTVYKIRAFRQDGTGTGTASIYNEGNAYSEFFAIRIA